MSLQPACSPRATSRPAAAAAFLVAALAGPAGAECTCPADFDGDGEVDVVDFLYLLESWGTPGLLGQPTCPGTDLNGDGDVDTSDFNDVLEAWGTCPGDEGACCFSAPDDCAQLTVFDCLAAKGDYQGNGTRCGPTGACCFNDGTCKQLAEACCEDRGGFFQGEGVACADALCATADLDVDTDRNGDIDGADEAGESVWTKPRGAFFMVNCNDSDGNRKEDGLRFNLNEMPVDEDVKINGEADKVDITPLVVRATGNLVGRKVYLEAPLAQLHTFHLFKKIEDGETKIWGGVGEANPRVEITAHVSATVDKELGVEGLYFRYIQGGHPMHFPGLLDLNLVIEKAATGVVVAADAVQIKVAPYLLLPNTQDSVAVYILHHTDSADFRAKVNADVPGQLETYINETQWAQDPIEIGYSEIPTGFMWTTGHTRHGGVDPTWVRHLLLGDSLGLYRLPRTVDADGETSGNFGGNIELLPPTTTHKLGRLCVGNSMSARQREFLVSQEVQSKPNLPPLLPFANVIDTNWLAVGHVDEIVGFIEGSPHKILLASPTLAYAICGVALAEDDPVPTGEVAPEDAVFFGLGASMGNVVIDGVAPENPYFIHVPGVDFTGQPWQYLQVYDNDFDPLHPSIGQTAHIAPGGLGNGFILIDAVMEDYEFVPTTGGSGIDCANELCTLGYSPGTKTDGWFFDPPPLSKIVLVEGTQFWDTTFAAEGGFIPAPGFPSPASFVTVKKVKTNAKLKALNQKAKARIEGVKTALTNAMTGDAVMFIEVPVIFTASDDLTPAGLIVPRSCVAWNPGLANVVVAGATRFFAKQFGPKNGLGQDLFEKKVIANVGGAPVFVDDWKLYHVKMGEVHCGSSVRRDPYVDPWWENQP